MENQSNSEAGEMRLMTVKQLRFISDTAYQAGAKAEREACAKVCESLVPWFHADDSPDKDVNRATSLALLALTDAARDIRARQSL